QTYTIHILHSYLLSELLDISKQSRLLLQVHNSILTIHNSYHHHNHQPFNIYPTTHHTNTTQFADQSNLVHTRYMAVRH
ncbi:hypothetical protein LINPERHAP1_LOCUS15858, partial [Linum perenne]